MRESQIERALALVEVKCQWKPVVGYEGLYEVSDKGVIRSKDRLTVDKRGHSKQFKGCVLANKRQSSGHLFVSLSRGGVKTHLRNHSLVLAAFIGPYPTACQIRHIDGNPTNNVLTNLVYGTCSENKLDAYKHGALKSGEKSHFAKVSNSDMEKIKKLKGEMDSNIVADHFGLSAGYVREVWWGEARRYA